MTCCARYRSDTQVSTRSFNADEWTFVDVDVDAADILPNMHTESCAYFVISYRSKPIPTTIYQLVQGFCRQRCNVMLEPYKVCAYSILVVGGKVLCDVAQGGSLKGPDASPSVCLLSSLFHARERLLLSERRVFM